MKTNLDLSLSEEERALLQEWRSRGPHTQHPLYLSSKKGVDSRLAAFKYSRSWKRALVLSGAVIFVTFLLIMIIQPFV